MTNHKLSVLQRGYLIGRKLNDRLGGVPCHVYIEAGGKKIEPERLQNAWEKVLERHPLLRCKAEDSEKLTGIENSPNRYIGVFDLRGTGNEEAASQLKKIRSVFSARTMRTESGHTCGLELIRLESGDILAFDFDLTAGDVYSFQVVLSDLAKAYSGTLDDDVVQPYISEEQYSAGNEKQGELLVFKMPLNADPDKLAGCKYKSIRLSFSRGYWNDIAEKMSFDISGYEVWKAVSALTFHKLSGLEKYYMNVPMFRSDKKSVSDNTKLALVKTEYREGESFGCYAERLADEIKKWNNNEYADGFEALQMLQKSAAPESWIAPIVFSSAEGILLLTEQFEECFGKINYMISQTPQVWADIQLFELPGSSEVYFMIPEGLFSQATENAITDVFTQIAVKLGDSEVPDKESI